jgi:hypothetical protein
MLLIGYLGEISSERTRIPNVIVLLLLGWLARQMVLIFDWEVPDLFPFLPLLGTIGLILIVLEGSLELRINPAKYRVIRKSVIMAITPMFLISLTFGVSFSLYAGTSFYNGLINSLPLAVVSSSIAIPSARNISPAHREFVIYESSFSDIIGVLFFNFLSANTRIDLPSVGLFLLQIILVTLVSLFSVMGLSYMLGRVKNHISYTPILLLVLLIYALAKAVDLSGLLFILVFGLFLENIQAMKNIPVVKNIISKIDTSEFNLEVIKFRSITVEATFLMRSLFFILFGYVMDTKEFLDLETLPWAFGVVIFIFGSRYFLLKLFKIPVLPILFFSPRGLVTVLLFLSVKPGLQIGIVNNSLIIQVIILSVIFMTLGLLRHREPGI